MIHKLLAVATLSLAVALPSPSTYTGHMVDKQEEKVVVVPRDIIQCPPWHGLLDIDPDRVNEIHPRVDLLDCTYKPEFQPSAPFPQPVVVRPFGCRYECGNPMRLYRVKHGDTLWGLLVRWGENPYDWPELAYVNDISDPHLLQAGATIADLP